jgi:hypothetical protein
MQCTTVERHSEQWKTGCQHPPRELIDGACPRLVLEHWSSEPVGYRINGFMRRTVGWQTFNDLADTKMSTIDFVVRRRLRY